MPWEIVEDAEGCSGYAVVKKDGGKVVGCHGEDLGKAKRQLRALYANALSTRVADLESAIVQLGASEFGDLPGHPFHGNQWTGGEGSNEERADRIFASVKVGDPIVVQRNGIKFTGIVKSKSDKLAQVRYRMRNGTTKTVNVNKWELFHTRDWQDWGEHDWENLSAQEFGDKEGHEFHGNQYTYRVGYSEDHEAMKNAEYKYTNVKVRAKDETEANLLAASMVGHKGIPTSTELISTQVKANLAGHQGEATVRPGDVIVDASNLNRPGTNDFDHLKGATIIESKQALGQGRLEYIDTNGVQKRTYIHGAEVTVERPAPERDIAKLATEGDFDG